MLDTSNSGKDVTPLRPHAG